MSSTYGLAWNLMVELRKEIRAAQKMRTQIMGFKIAFVSSALGVIIGAITANPAVSLVFVIPAITAITFDFSINSINHLILRLGFYIRKAIEPQLALYGQWPKDKPLWEEFLCQEGARQPYGIIGSLGLTAIALMAALYPVVSFCVSGNYGLLAVATVLFTVVVILFVIDVKIYYKVKNEFPKDRELEK